MDRESLVSCADLDLVQRVTSKTYDHGVQTGTVENTRGTDQALSRLELGLEVGLLLGSAGGKGRAIVEALEGTQSRGDGRGESHEGRSLTHLDDYGT